jgi:tRNA A37 threonylcarbamoyladenosine synthetase subunit TsaC/SUA5/YrdC
VSILLASLLILVADFPAKPTRLGPALDILRAGGLGVVPTDTSYAFACMLNSRKGTERIFEVKHYVGQRKPLALLVSQSSCRSPRLC